MNVHEYQAKKVLEQYGTPIPAFAVASNEAEVLHAIKHLGLKEAVIKIQVHAGGRGKAGGVKFAKSPEEILRVAKSLIGMKLVNNQTGSEGVIAHKILLSKPIDIKKEYYIAALIDRDRAEPILIASREGGMEIEEVAAKHPDKILKTPIELDGRVRSFRKVRLCKFMGWEGELAKEGGLIIDALAKAFIETDAALLEINPLVEDAAGHLFALDAKLTLDDNALFRHKELAAFYDPSQESKNEVEAKKYDLAFIALDGTIGCMVNGAGLAMATMDIIHYYGGTPANFLDVGGGASMEKVAEGFKILLSDPKIEAILVNIFGGIMNCKTLAEGILSAAKQLTLRVPLVVRMEGTNVEEGKALLHASKLPIITADNLAEAAEKVVKASLG
jgi:succinyl-CoA synthetase beta subunit